MTTTRRSQHQLPPIESERSIPASRAIPLAILGVSVALGLAIGAMPSPDAFAPVILQILIVVVPVIVAARSLAGARSSIRQGLGLSHIGSIVFAFGALIAIALPGAQLLGGLRQSRLVLNGFHDLSPIHDVSAAYALTLLALLSVVVGEELASRWRPAKRRFSWRRLSHLPALESRFTYFCLLALGILGVLLAPHTSAQDAFTSRTHSHGMGIIVTLVFCTPVAVAGAVLASHWHSRILPAISTIAIAQFVLYTGERSPLLIVGAAVMVRILIGFANAQNRIRYVIAVIAVIYVGAALLVGISNWRALVIQGYQPSVVSQVYAASLDPFGNLAAGGLDTLDGMTLAMKIDPIAVGASWTDLTKAVTGFVPSQIWPSKPGWLSGVVAHYTNIGGDAGMFLSGPGYLYIILGGAFGVGLGFCLLGFLIELLMVRLRTPLIATALVVYFLMRFFFAGDAYDIFHTGTLFVGLFTGYSLGALLNSLQVRLAPVGSISPTRSSASSRYAVGHVDTD